MSLRVNTLILDTSAILSSNNPTARLNSLARQFVTIPEVLNEVRDRSSKENLEKLVLIGADNAVQDIQLKEPTAESYARGKSPASFKEDCQPD
jgi:rRNA maturation endonuclease Nob1